MDYTIIYTGDDIYISCISTIKGQVQLQPDGAWKSFLFPILKIHLFSVRVVVCYGVDFHH